MHTKTNQIEADFNSACLSPRLNTSQLPVNGNCRLYTSLNCNRIALKCLKIRGNRLSDSLIMAAVGGLLQWFDSQLVNPIRIDEIGAVRKITLLGCIQYQRDESTKSFSSYLRLEKSQSRLIPCPITLGQWLPENWMEAIVNLKIPAVYLKEIRQNSAVYRCLLDETSRLLQTDQRFQHLMEYLIPYALAIDEQQLAISQALFPQGKGSFDDLTQIWRNKALYLKMIDEENPLLRLFHLTRIQGLRHNKRQLKAQFKTQPRQRISSCF